VVVQHSLMAPWAAELSVETGLLPVTPPTKTFVLGQPTPDLAVQAVETEGREL
jgi:hypothetical protein